MSDLHPAPAQTVQVSKDRKLTTLMLTNIIILSLVGIASILIMLFGTFDGKGIRVTSTFLVFAAFTAFTAWDSNDKNPRRYVPIGQVGNIYMLALSLMQIWLTLGGSSRTRYYGSSEILWNVFVIILLVKIGVILVQKISDYTVRPQASLALFALISTGAFAITTVLFTLPSGLKSLMTFGDGYWKLSTAVILLAGLSLSVMVLLAWFFKEIPTRHAGLAQRNNAPQKAVFGGGQNPPANQVHTVQETAPLSPPAPAVPPFNGAPQFSPPVATAIPWPVFPSGLPLPAKANGRPDFTALRDVAARYAEAENQWFGE
jgi:hypothetical protein